MYSIKLSLTEKNFNKVMTAIITCLTYYSLFYATAEGMEFNVA